MFVIYIHMNTHMHTKYWCVHLQTHKSSYIVIASLKFIHPASSHQLLCFHLRVCLCVCGDVFECRFNRNPAWSQKKSSMGLKTLRRAACLHIVWGRADCQGYMTANRGNGSQSAINCPTDLSSTSQVGCHALISLTDPSSGIKQSESQTPAGLTITANSVADPSSVGVTGARQVNHTTSTTKRHSIDLTHTWPVCFHTTKVSDNKN